MTSLELAQFFNIARDSDVDRELHARLARGEHQEQAFAAILERRDAFEDYAILRWRTHSQKDMWRP